ncbi:Subtilisin-like protease [Euphorbia peplus]|nr:Subtilisin-like protease [Euphorbia peplus]
MGERPMGKFSASMLHSSMLQQIVGSGASDYLLRSYHRSFNGFAAKLTQEEKQKMAGMEGVVSVFLSQKKTLHTTRSWNFMNFPVNTTRSTNEGNIIVGMLDTGVWPESRSFNDEGFGPPPSKWKGTCQGNSNFTCNNKIIGARYYHSGRELKPEKFALPRNYFGHGCVRDSRGHGTHTASIKAGEIVSKASLLGLASGTARGGVPSARISVYKVCWHNGCSEADILAAFDDAIADGVDIISLSVGGGPKTISRSFPFNERWKFVTEVKLGNGATYEGISINTFSPENTTYPMIYGGNALNNSAGNNSRSSSYCSLDTLNKTMVEGKIVLCDDGFAEKDAHAIGAFGIVSTPRLYTDVAFGYSVPASLISDTNITDCCTI